ncbi:MAG: phosphoribosylformylglycinamidine cyclo-ligase [Clostridiales bacterium]|nr:phosphoribosylformylglycinamidine cyclo-ligase [Clostridiales bacterium]MDY4036695.1 phosphoribosylformylglycinamidine cyclo-ligase [Candidatus Pseudoscilispira sp.]
MSISKSDSYAAAGVDVTAGYASNNLIKPMVESTYIPGVIGTLGGFGGCLQLPAGYTEPVLVSGTDGVGTKLKLAYLMDRHDTVGVDCVAMCVNDIICGGAKPLFFLDYMAMGKNVPERTAEIVKGVVEGCKQAGCALIGGETAEMPGLYAEDEYDLAGYSTGIVEKSRMLDNSGMTEGDVLIGLAASGCHSNGFSLIRKVFNIDSDPDVLNRYTDRLGKPLGEVLITPTRIYVKSVLRLLDEGLSIHGISHITGGGFYENVPRMMKEGLTAEIDTSAYELPEIFKLLAEVGEIPMRDMYNTFNMGIGMVLALPAGEAEKALKLLREAGETACRLGVVTTGEDAVVVK